NIVVNQLNVTSDNVSINGMRLSDYITSLLPGNTSTLRHGENISTNVISPLSQTSDIALSLENSQLSILNPSATESAVATIDNQGNAQFNGTLTAQNIESEGNATIAGSLTVDTLKAKTIEGLEDTVNSLASRFMGTHNESGNYIDVSTMSAQFALFHENLLSLGTTTMREAAIMDSLSIGTQLMIGPESLDVLGSDLQIQPLRQGGVSFLGGMMALDRDGNLHVGGNAQFAQNVTINGGLFANILSPLAEHDLDILLGQKNSTESSKFRIVNGSKTPVLTINDRGDVYSSGSAEFMGDLVASGSAFLSKLNIFSQDAQAVSENEMVASSSAGTAILKAYKREVTIKSPYVQAKSLIYVTPNGDTGNQVLYLLRQSENGSFTVGVSDVLNRDISFNWIVVN
ncbi:MAG TPA: hypothetical protein PLD54_03065, partial [Candidatus Levybacteria bacterium]|nr:hypothetical protein [Candidatus Levybacteria bacterium]